VTLPCLRETGAGVELFLLVQPRASRNQVAGLQGTELKICLTAPPVDGAANRACQKFVARLCHVPKNRVVLLGGEASRHKRLLLKDVGLPEVEAHLQESLGP
jgi:uncharacterized protein